MEKVITWVCRNCAQSLKLPEGKHPNDSTCDKGIGIHDWQPVSVEEVLK